MADQDGGSVINISSVMALISGRGFLSYGTAKGALADYTRLAAQDLAPRIRVNAIAAGTVATTATEMITGDPALRSRVEAATPMRRLATVDDIAAAVTLAVSGRYPQRIFDLDMGLKRWCYRVLAYVALMRDEYPPFRLDNGGADPGHLSPPPARPAAPQPASSGSRP